MALPIKKTAAKKTTVKPKMSRSEAMRELAMQSRGTGKGVGPKARARRILAKTQGKTVAKAETAAAKRGGSMPVSAAAKKKAASIAATKKKDKAMAGRKPASVVRRGGSSRSSYSTM